MKAFEQRITAEPADIDELGHVNNAVWVRWIQEVATAHWYALADPAHHAAYVWFIVRHEIDYLRGLAVGESVTGRTWVADAPRGARMDRHVEFVGDDGVALIGVEAAGHGMDSGAHAASISAGKKGVLHGALMYLMSDDDGQISPAHSVSAGLDYPGVGPEHSYYADAGVAEYVGVDDTQALEAFGLLSRIEGIIPALETAHAVSYALKLAGEMSENEIIVVNLSGRGDKDVTEAMRVMKMQEESREQN